MIELYNDKQREHIERLAKIRRGMKCTWNHGHPHSEETKLKISIALRGKLKGRKQSPEHIAKKGFQAGESHPNWVGSSASIKTGRSRAERLFKIIPCESCGEQNKKIDRHHIDRNTLNNNPENIKFLCRLCHMKEDGRYENFLTVARRKKNCLKSI